MEEARVIDFTSRESHLLLNPRMPASEREALERIVPTLEGHVFVATSGSTGAQKLIALSKAAVLASAEAVNRRLDARVSDIWCAVLPAFHVGGLGIHARATLSGSRVISMEWDPRRFAATHATLASLVPTQMYDLVTAQRRPRSSLRAVLVGGGAFDRELRSRAEELGWPVLATYGMSECASTVAIEEELLSHLQARREEDGRLSFRGASLLTAYVTPRGLDDPKHEGWFTSEDLGEVEGRLVRVFGRTADFVKIGGESVDLRRLDAILREITDEAAVVAVPDERLGFVIHLAVAGDADRIAAAFDERVLPFERARRVHRVEAIPRSSLGKVQRGELARMVGSPKMPE